jgi:hypothetical protein
VVPAHERPILGVRASHLRPHATVLKVAFACGAAFVTVSITQKGGAAGVRCCAVVGKQSDSGVFACVRRMLHPQAVLLSVKLLPALCH